jgi:hypothetical protein
MYIPQASESQQVGTPSNTGKVDADLPGSKGAALSDNEEHSGILTSLAEYRY